MSQSSYLSRQEVDEKLAADETYLRELVERQRELRAALAPIIGELKDVNAQVARGRKGDRGLVPASPRLVMCRRLKVEGPLASRLS